VRCRAAAAKNSPPLRELRFDRRRFREISPGPRHNEGVGRPSGPNRWDLDAGWCPRRARIPITRAAHTLGAARGVRVDSPACALPRC